jgi:DNA-binding HxlR family transcriptional regulator
MDARRRNGGAPVESALDPVRKRWKASVVLELAGGALRYAELQSRLAVPHKVLTEVLRELESDALLVRAVRPFQRRHVTYGLTATGLKLVPILRALEEWRVNGDS